MGQNMIGPFVVFLIGYLVLESYASPEEIEAMRKRMDELLDEFDPSTTKTVFSTKTHVTFSNI